MFKSFFKFFSSNQHADKGNASSAEETMDEKIRKSVSDFINRPIYKELTGDIINNASDDKLLQTVFDNLSEKFPKEYFKEYETVLSFSKGQQAIYVIWWLEAEVNNGGFNQYYANSSGIYAEITPEALRLVGANRFADLVAKANNIFETENEQITKHQDGTPEGFSKSYNDNPLSQCDDEFFEVYKNEKLDKLQIEFIRKNKNEFIDK